MNSKPRTLQNILRRLGVFILCAGLVATCLIYWSADQASGATAYSIVGGNAYASVDMGSKSDRYEVQRYGGDSAVVVHNFNRWLSSLWHGKRLAFTLAAIAILLAYACFWTANEMDEQSNDQPPG
jgi:hypothetical protein